MSFKKNITEKADPQSRRGVHTTKPGFVLTVTLNVVEKRGKLSNGLCQMFLLPSRQQVGRYQQVLLLVCSIGCVV